MRTLVVLVGLLVAIPAYARGHGGGSHSGGHGGGPAGAVDGTIRCLPQVEGGIRFLDAACTDPVVAMPASTCGTDLPYYFGGSVKDGAGGCPSRPFAGRPVSRRGNEKPWPGTSRALFISGSLGCVPAGEAPADTRLFEQGPDADPNDLLSRRRTSRRS